MTEPAAPAAFTYTRGPAAFAILVGIAVIAIWGYLVLSGGLPELEARPLAMGIHVAAAEMLTGVALVAAGLGLARRRGWARKAYLLAVGMLLFAVIHGVGFYGERGEVGLVLLFIVLGVLGIFFAMRAEE